MGSEFASGSTTKDVTLISTSKHGVIAYTVNLPRRSGRRFPGKDPQQETLPFPRRLSLLRVASTQMRARKMCKKSRLTVTSSQTGAGDGNELAV